MQSYVNFSIIFQLFYLAAELVDVRGRDYLIPLVVIIVSITTKLGCLTVLIKHRLYYSTTATTTRREKEPVRLSCRLVQSIKANQSTIIIRLLLLLVVVSSFWEFYSQIYFVYDLMKTRLRKAQTCVLDSIKSIICL